MKKFALRIFALSALLSLNLYAEPVALNFDWYPGLKLNVASASEGNTTFQSEYELEVDSLGRDLSVSVKEFTLSDSQLPSAPNMNLPEEALELMAAAPNIKVTTNGLFGGVTDATARVEAAKQSISGVVEAGGLNIPPQLEAFVGTALNEASMESAAGNAWNSLVGFWAGKTLEPGKWETDVSLSTVPMFPNTELEMDVQYRLAEEGPCSDGYAGEGCVVLEKITKPKDGSLKELMKVFLTEAMGSADINLESIKELSVENKTTLITDPKNLHPQRLEVETSFRIVMQMGGMVLPVVEQVEKQTLRYTYPKPE